MRRIASGCLLAATALFFVARASVPVVVGAQQPGPVCLHGPDETTEEAARRTAALGFTRHINTLEATSFPSTNSYQPASGLTLSRSLPDGFTLNLTANATGYAFSVRDMRDKCAFAYFSDQNGIIFRGEAIR
jgi:hypothetical protein